MDQGSDHEDHEEQKDKKKEEWLAQKRQERITEAKAYTMSWLCDALCSGRILVGPFITDPKDALRLSQEVTHIVNLCPLTEEKTKSGLDKNSWYMCFFENEPEETVTLIREPLITESMTDAKKIAHYLAIAKRIALILETSGTKIYLHYRTGFSEEAFIAFLVWYMHDKRTFPVDVGMWLVNNQYERLLDNEEQRALLNEAIDVLKHQQAVKNSGSMLRFVKSTGQRPTKKIKE